MYPSINRNTSLDSDYNFITNIKCRKIGLYVRVHKAMLMFPEQKPAKTDMQQIVFGITFSSPSNKVILFRQHLYSLFLLLYYYGEEKHKKVIRQKIQKIIKASNLKILELSSRKFENQNFFDSKTYYKNQKFLQDQIKALVFTNEELNKNMKGHKLQLHSISQRSLIRKAFILICQDNIHLIQQIQMSFLGICQIAGLLLNIQFRVQNYYGCYIASFISQVFIDQGIMVYIYFDKQKQTYSYIKQKSSFTQTHCKKNKSQSRMMLQSSFKNLLKFQISIQQSDSTDHEPGSEDLQQSQVFLNYDSHKKFRYQCVLQNVFDDKPECLIEKLSEEQSEQIIQENQPPVILQQESQIDIEQQKDEEQSQTLNHDQNIGNTISTSRMQDKKQSQNKKKFFQEKSAQISVPTGERQQQKQSNFYKQQLQQQIKERNSILKTQSAYIPKPKVQNRRKTSDTFLETLRLSDNPNFQSFVRFIDEQINKPQINNIGEQKSMCVSKIYPIVDKGEMNPVFQNQSQFISLDQLGKLLKAIEDIDQPQNNRQQRKTQDQVQRQNTLKSLPETLNILIGIMKQRKEKNILKFIEEARLRMSASKMNTAYIEQQISNQTIHKETCNKNQPNTKPLNKESEGTQRYLQQQVSLETSSYQMFSKIFRIQGLRDSGRQGVNSKIINNINFCIEQEQNEQSSVPSNNTIFHTNEDQDYVNVQIFEINDLEDQLKNSRLTQKKKYLTYQQNQLQTKQNQLQLNYDKSNQQRQVTQMWQKTTLSNEQQNWKNNINNLNNQQTNSIQKNYNESFKCNAEKHIQLKSLKQLEQHSQEQERQHSQQTNKLKEKLSHIVYNQSIKRKLLQKKVQALQSIIKKSEKFVSMLYKHGNNNQKQKHLQKVKKIRQQLQFNWSKQIYYRKQMSLNKLPNNFVQQIDQTISHLQF